MVDVVKNLQTRVSFKLFTDEVIPTDVVNKLVEACNLTPTSMGMQLTRLLIVKSPEMKEKLKPATYYQKQISTCSHLFILLTKYPSYEEDCSEYLERLYEKRPESNNLEHVSNYMTKHFKELEDDKGMEWARNQTYITLGNLVTSASLMGVDTCPLEGFNPETYKEILGDLIKGYEPTVLCALGYGDKNDERFNQKKIRIENQSYNLGII